MFGLFNKKILAKAMAKKIEMLPAGFVCFDADNNQVCEEKLCTVIEMNDLFIVTDSQGNTMTYQYLAESELTITKEQANIVYWVGEGFRICKVADFKNKLISFTLSFPDGRAIVYHVRGLF